MSASAHKMRAIYLVGLLVGAAVLPSVATTGALAVAGNVATSTAGDATFDTQQTVRDEFADYEVSATYPDTTGTVDTIRVNFTGTGAGLNPDRVFVTNRSLDVNGTSLDVRDLSEAKGGEALDVVLNTPVSVDGPVTTNLTVYGVQNPSTPDTYNVTLDLRDGGSTLTRANDTITIVEGGDVNGTVTDADSGAAITDESARVEVYNATTKQTVDTYGLNPNTGTYNASLPPGSYLVNVTADGYARESVSVANLDNGESVVRDVALDTGGWVNGTVTNESDVPVGGIKVVAVRDPSGEVAKEGTTASDGSYSFPLAPETSSYTILAAPDSAEYELGFRQGVSVVQDETTTVDLTTPVRPETGRLEVTVEGPDGSAISDAIVEFRSSDYEYGGQVTTDGSGVAVIQKPAETYTLRIEASGYGPTVLRDVTIGPNMTSTVTASLESPATISGSVTAPDDSSAPNVPVLVSDGEEFYPTVTDPSGDYSVTVPPGEYSVAVFAEGADAPTETASVTSGDSPTVDFSLITASVVNTNATITAGPGDQSDLGVRTSLRSGLLKFQLVDDATYSGPTDRVGEPDDLTSLGVTRETEFNITVTVTNFDADSLIWGLRDARWRTVPNETVTNGTDIIIEASTVDLQAVDPPSNGVGPLLFESPSQVDWPTGQEAAADQGFAETVYFGLFDLSTVPGQVKANLNGISTTTNAQRFAPPTYQNGTIRVWLAGPSKNTAGDDHTGFYQATIPDAQLDAWGVDDPETELQVTYKDRPREFTVTEVPDGARILVDNISYSASYAKISPDQSAVDGSGTTGDGSGTTSDESFGVVSGDGATTGPTTTEAATATETATATPSPTVTGTETEAVSTAAAETETTPSSPEPTTETAATSTSTATEQRVDSPVETTGGTGPGFGLVAAIVAMLATALLARRD